MSTKKCYYGDCKSDMRLRNNENLHYYRYPNPTKRPLLFERWMKASGWDTSYADKFSYSKSSRYVCSKHFIDKVGPNKINPDPVQANGKVIMWNDRRKFIPDPNTLETIPSQQIDDLVPTTDSTNDTDDLILGVTNNIVPDCSVVKTEPEEEDDISLNPSNDNQTMEIDTIGTEYIIAKTEPEEQTGDISANQPIVKTEPVVMTEDVPCIISSIQTLEEINGNANLLVKWGKHTYSFPKADDGLSNENQPLKDVEPAFSIAVLKNRLGAPKNWSTFYALDHAIYSKSKGEILELSYYVFKDGSTKIAILGNETQCSIFNMDSSVLHVSDVVNNLEILDKYSVCPGNSKSDFPTLASFGSGVYCQLTNSVHSKQCSVVFNITDGRVKRCKGCKANRAVLRKMVCRCKTDAPKKKFAFMTKQQLVQNVKNGKRRETYLTTQYKLIKEKYRRLKKGAKA